MIFSIIPFLRAEMVGGQIVRNSIAISCMLYLLPLVFEDAHRISTLGDGIYAVFLKEIFLGAMIGYLVTLPFWMMEALGNVIDNQRGAAAAGFDEVTSNESTGLGRLFSQIIFVMFFVSGGYLNFLGWVYQTYTVWPVHSFYPSFDADVVGLALGFLDTFMHHVVLLAAPVILCMFVAEFGLGLVGRFAPSLNVFVVAIPIKAGIAILMLIIYLPKIAFYMSENGEIFSNMYQIVEQVVR